jgi:hypothetical protein
MTLPRAILIFLHHTDVDDRLDQRHFVAHTAPRRIGNAGAIDQIPLESVQSWQEKASDALGLDGKKTLSYTPFHHRTTFFY